MVDLSFALFWLSSLRIHRFWLSDFQKFSSNLTHTMAARKFFVGGNWKMNGDTKSIDGIVAFLNDGVKGDSVEVVVAPPAPYLAYVKAKLTGNVHVAAQNAYKEPKGAFTGEISPAMIKDLGLSYVILGHSERRHVFGEGDELIAAKTVHAIENGLTVIFCIGEKLDEREADKTKEVSDWFPVLSANLERFLDL